MVVPWRIAALLLALLPALAQPAAAGEFSVEEQKLVADIRQKMDQTTQLLIYAYENEEKMDLAEMKRVMVGFRELAKWFENKIPDRSFERRTGSFCVGAASFASSYWRETESYYKYKGDEKGKYVGAPRTLQELRNRQKDDLEGHFWVVLKCRIHLEQIPTQLEEKARAPKISLKSISLIREDSLKLMEFIQKNKDKTDKITDKQIMLQSGSLFKKYFSIYNMRIGEGSLFCEALVDMPLFTWKEYIKRHGPISKEDRLPTDLYQIGFDFLIKQYYKNVTLCDNHIKKYKEKRP